MTCHTRVEADDVVFVGAIAEPVRDHCSMDQNPYDTWHVDAELLAEIGHHLFTQQL
jgi:hypothetical protein